MNAAAHNVRMDSQDHRPRVAAERRERMRARLLDSTLALVVQRGLGAATIDDVTSAAQVSRGTFYNYFETPDAVVRELALEISNEMLRLAEPLVQRHADPVERLAMGMRVVIGTGIAHPAIGSFSLRLGWPDLDRRHLIFEYAQRDVEAALRAGRFDAMPVALALDIVSSTVLGAIHVALMARGEPSIGAIAVAGGLRALGVRAREAERLVRSPLSLPEPAEGGLIARSSSQAGAATNPIRGAPANRATA